MIELTETQQEQLSSSDTVVFDPRTQAEYVLVRRDAYERLRALLSEDDVLHGPLKWWTGSWPNTTPMIRPWRAISPSIERWRNDSTRRSPNSLSLAVAEASIRYAGPDSRIAGVQ